MDSPVVPAGNKRHQTGLMHRVTGSARGKHRASVDCLHSNSGTPLARKSAAVFLAILELWKPLIQDQRDARRRTLAKLSELTQLLGVKGATNSHLSTKIDILATEYSTIDRELSHVIMGNVMSLNNQPRNTIRVDPPSDVRDPNPIRHYRMLAGSILPHPLRIGPSHSASANLSGDDRSGPMANAVREVPTYYTGPVLQNEDFILTTKVCSPFLERQGG